LIENEQDRERAPVLFLYCFSCDRHPNAMPEPYSPRRVLPTGKLEARRRLQAPRAFWLQATWSSVARSAGCQNRPPTASIAALCAVTIEFPTSTIVRR
jgi:hypothetical protein